MSTTPFRQLEEMQNVRTPYFVGSNVSSEDLTETLSEIQDIVYVALSSYSDLGESGKNFVESFSHYAGLTADCAECVAALEEAEEEGLDDDSLIVEYFTSKLYDKAISRQNQSIRVRGWYGIADAESDLWSYDNQPGVLRDFNISEEVWSSNPSELVRRIDDLSIEMVERVDSLPEKYREKMLDWDEMGHSVAGLDSQYKALDLSS